MLSLLRLLDTYAAETDSLYTFPSVTSLLEHLPKNLYVLFEKWSSS